MSYKTLDSVIAELQALKAQGVPGDTPMGTPHPGNNGKGGFIHLDARVYFARIAKEEADKHWTICRTVSRGGKQVLVFG